MYTIHAKWIKLGMWILLCTFITIPSYDLGDSLALHGETI